MHNDISFEQRVPSTFQTNKTQGIAVSGIVVGGNQIFRESKQFPQHALLARGTDIFCLGCRPAIHKSIVLVVYKARVDANMLCRFLISHKLNS